MQYVFFFFFLVQVIIFLNCKQLRPGLYLENAPLVCYISFNPPVRPPSKHCLVIISQSSEIEYFVKNSFVRNEKNYNYVT